MDFIKRLLALRFRISTQLFAAFGVAVALTVAASLIGWFSFGRVGTAQAAVNEGSIPEMQAAFGVAEYSRALGAAAPRLATATNNTEVAFVWLEIADARKTFNDHLETLDAADAVRAERINIYSDSLVDYIETIRDNAQRGFDIAARTEELQAEMGALRADMDANLVPAVDNELFYLLTGRRERGGLVVPRHVHFSIGEFGTYWHLSELNTGTNIALQQLSTTFSILDPALVEAEEERFESTIASLERNLTELEDTTLQRQLEPLYDRLRDLGLSSDGIFVVLRSNLLLAQEQEALLGLSQQQTASLVNEADFMVSNAVASAEVAADTTTQAISTGSTLLLIISVISALAAVLISWLFVGRVLLHRINMLSQRMRRMAGGELEEEVQIVGHDELAEMAGALEVFRHNSLEALRLNLVEELNQELEGKNAELEVVLTDLQTAQDQIVMREKLAALGEVTAGVAHEIRNPLNFVKNFSESSEELLLEMREAIEDGGESLDVSLINDISNDLVENLERIRHHGDRANRIVNDMLLMGRGSNNWQPIDLNTLLVEHAMLAYHSARATDTEFQLTVEQDLDEQVGDVEAIPQDLGRTFLNIVGNACQATDEKRRTLAAAGIGFDGYAPTVWLSTRGMDEEVEVRIRDNGPGIPQDIIDKIFNPFFTTKPTNQGTGLGLAITSDIIRQHGGSINVESEPDQYTEMVIIIPRTPPPEVALPDSDHAAAAT